MATSSEALHTPANADSFPSAWPWTRLDDICDAIVDCPHSTPALTDAGPFVVRSQDVRSGVFRAESAAHVSESTYRERIARAEPRLGDLIYSREGTYFGIAAEVPKDLRVCLGQRMVLIRPRPSVVNARFLKYWLNSPTVAALVGGLRDGSVAERLNLPTIRGLPVVVPPLAYQEGIASALGALDDKIELNRRMNRTIESIARAIFKSWLVDFDPVRKKMEGGDPGLPPDLAALFPSELEESILGPIPRGWQCRSLKDVARFAKGRSYKSAELAPSDTALVTLKSFNRTGGYRDDGLKEFTGSYKADQVVRPGDVLVAHTDVTQAADVLGRAVRVRPSSRHKTLVASLDTSIVRPAESNLSREFLFFALESQRFRDHSYGYCNGTTVLHLGAKALPEFCLVTPPPDLVSAFSSVARVMLERADLLASESDVLTATRDALLPKLLSGGLPLVSVGSATGRANE